MPDISTNIADFRDLMVAKIRDHFPKKVVHTVTIHEGELDLPEIIEYGKRPPAIVLTLNGSDSVMKAGGTIKTLFEISGFVVTRDHGGIKRGRLALILIEHFLRILTGIPQWGNSAPSKLSLVNLFDRKLDEVGLCLWVVKWEQVIDIPALTGFATLDAFARVNIVMGDVPESADEQQIELEQ
jgi:hypothetical protein